MVCAGVDLVDAKAVVDDVGELGAKPLAVVGEQRHRHPHRVVYWSMKMSAVPSTVNCTAVMANISVRRRDAVSAYKNVEVVERGERQWPKWSALTVMPGLSGGGR